jgi:type I restriction enzyme S subunit
MLITLDLEDESVIHYFKYWLIRKNLNTMVFGSGQPLITGTQLKEIVLPRPKVTEQTAIANALADVDALIHSLEKLIAKKQAIKTATMQQLLTGRTRLPQFALREDGTPNDYKPSELGEIPEDWEVTKVSAFVSGLEAGVSVNSLDSQDAFPHGKHILKTSCVAAGYFYPYEYKSILPRDVFRSKVTPRSSSIIISRMNTPDLVGELGYVEETCPDSYLPDRLWQMVFHRQAEVNTRWLAFILSFPLIAKKIKESATGISNSMKNISKESLLSIEIPAPPMIEQTAIATLLSDMDAEIQTLRKRLAKTRQIKQGMMQELLTGKTRLV